MSHLTEEQRKRLEAKRAQAVLKRQDLLGRVNKDSRNAEQKKFETKKKYRHMIKKSDYIHFDISTTEDTRGGYLAETVDKEEKTLDDWKDQQLLQKQERLVRDPAPPLDIANAPKCYECGALEINPKFLETFQCRVCNACRQKLPEKYSLLTKTECKEDYFLTEPELMDTSLFNKIEKPNPHAKFSRMQLFLRYQIEEFAFKKWGGAEGLDQEWLRREKVKIERKNKQFETKLRDMRKRTRAQEYTRRLKEKKNQGSLGHMHMWKAVDVQNGVTRKQCLECGMTIEEEEI